MNENYNKLLKEIKRYLNKNEILLVEKAYLYAKEKHTGQFRKTGEEYINHPLEVSLILTEIKADCDTICAALLHDTIEDTNATKEEIEKIFNPTIAKLVSDVTKINSINVSTESEYLSSYYKKIIVGMSEDVRVIIIKLADRLHNLRKIYVLPEAKQKAKAKETLEILTPIAHHLGMYKIKSELEDLSLRYLKPDAYFDIVEKLNNTKIEREEYINKMMKEVSLLLKQNKIKHEIKGRVKSIYSIYKKLDKGRSFSDIYDVLAIRILVEKEQECYLALGLIHSKYKPLAKRFKDYIAMPKTNLYQTLHTTVFGLAGNLFEIQIRTYDMDEIAENGIASHWAYKERKNASAEMQNVTEKKLQFYKSIIELNNEKVSAEDFINSVKDEVLNNNIYVYTPKGDVIELPVDSTPIDFAYKVHSEIGDKMIGAVVNNSIVPISHKLKNGDIIKITTNKNSIGPSREWINIAKTTQAKSKIKSFFNKNNKDLYITEGQELLEKELKRNKITLNKFYEKENINKILDVIKVNNLEELYYNIRTNKISVQTIIKDKKQEKKEETSIIKNIISPKIKKENDIIVDNIRNIKTNIASCCLPIPGDELIGYITKNNGISIHRINCINILEKNEKSIPCQWKENTEKKYLSELLVYTKNQENITSDLVNVAVSCNIIIDSFNTISKEKMNTYALKIYVKDLNNLETYIKNLYKIKHVSKIERTMK